MSKARYLQGGVLTGIYDLKYAVVQENPMRLLFRKL